MRLALLAYGLVALLSLASCTQGSSSSDPAASTWSEDAFLQTLTPKLTRPDAGIKLIELDHDGAPPAFAAFGQGHNVALSSTGVTLSYAKEKAPASATADLDAGRVEEQVTISFPGARAGISGTGLLPTASLTNVLWDGKFQSDVPAYEAVKYEDVYPGVDLYYFNGGTDVSFVFVVKPNGDPGAIHLAVSGADSSALDSSGVLIVKKDGGELQVTHPVSFQTTASGQADVTSDFQPAPGAGASLADAQAFGIKIGDYRRDQPLVVDPTILYATLLGTGSDTRISREHVSGDVYVGGPAGSYGDGSGVFYLARHDGATGALLGQTLMFGSSTDLVRGIYALGGTLYVAGDTSSPTLFSSFPSSPPPLQAKLAGESDAYVATFDRLTLAPTYGTYYGGAMHDSAAGIRADADGNIYLGGYTESADFPLASGTAAAAGFDSFMMKFKPNAGGAGDIAYARVLGGARADELTDVGLDRNGNFYAVGRTSSSDLPLVNAIPLTYDPALLGFNPFLVKLDPTGTVLFSSFAHANDVEKGVFSLGMDVSPDGSAIGFGGMVFDTNFQLVGYLAKIVLDPTSQRYVVAYTNKPQGTSTIVHDVALDAGKNLYGVGEAGADFSVTEPTSGLAGVSAFLYVLSDKGGAPTVLYSKLFGGTGTDQATDLVIDPKTNDLFIAGATTSDPFTGLDGSQVTGGVATGFLIKVSAVVPPPPENLPPAAKLAVSGNLVVPDVTFAISPDTLNLSSNGNWVTASIANDPHGVAAVQLDASGSADPDSDPLTFKIAVTGDGQSWEVDGQATATLKLPAGSYAATVTVCDPSQACDTAQAAFTVTALDLGQVKASDLTLNGVAADSLSFDQGILTVKFSRSGFGATVAVGDAVPGVLDGALHAVDYIRVIDQGNGGAGGGKGKGS